MANNRPNKVQFGLKNVHYAPYEETENGIVYEKPIAIPGAVTLTLTPRGELSEFHADNMIYYSAAANDGYDGTDRKSTRLNSSHVAISYAVFCLKKKNYHRRLTRSLE